MDEASTSQSVTSEGNSAGPQIALARPTTLLRSLCGPERDLAATTLVSNTVRSAVETRRRRTQNFGRLTTQDAFYLLSQAFSDSSTPLSNLADILLRFAQAVSSDGQVARGRSHCASCGCSGAITSCLHRLYCCSAASAATAILTHPSARSAANGPGSLYSICGMGENEGGVAVQDTECPFCGLLIWCGCKQIEVAVHIYACFVANTVRCRKPSSCRSCSLCPECNTRIVLEPPLTTLETHSVACNTDCRNLLTNYCPRLRDSEFASLSNCAFKALQPYAAGRIIGVIQSAPVLPQAPSSRNSEPSDVIIDSIASAALGDVFESSPQLTSPHSTSDRVPLSAIVRCVFPRQSNRIIDLGVEQEISTLQALAMRTQPCDRTIAHLPMLTSEVATEVARLVNSGCAIYIQIGCINIALSNCNNPQYYGTLHVLSESTLECKYTNQGLPKKPRTNCIFNPNREPALHRPPRGATVSREIIPNHRRSGPSTVSISSSGNCFYQSVACSTHRTTPALCDREARLLRWRAAKHILAHYDRYSPLYASLREFPLSAAVHGAHASSVDILAVSDLLGERIYLHTHMTGDSSLMCYPDCSGCGTHLWYNGGHYEPIVTLQSGEWGYLREQCEASVMDVSVASGTEVVFTHNSSSLHCTPVRTPTVPHVQLRLNFNSEQSAGAVGGEVSGAVVEQSPGAVGEQSRGVGDVGEQSPGAVGDVSEQSRGVGDVGEQSAADVGEQSAADVGEQRAADVGEQMECDNCGGSRDNLLDIEPLSPEGSEMGSIREFLDDRELGEDVDIVCSSCGVPTLATRISSNGTCLSCVLSEAPSSTPPSSPPPLTSTPAQQQNDSALGLDSPGADSTPSLCVVCLMHPPIAGGVECANCQLGPSYMHSFLAVSDRPGDTFVADKSTGFPCIPETPEFPPTLCESSITAYFNIYDRRWYCDSPESPPNQFYLYEFYTFYAALPPLHQTPPLAVSAVIPSLDNFPWHPPEARESVRELPVLECPQGTTLSASQCTIATRPIAPCTPASAGQQLLLQPGRQHPFASAVIAASIKLAKGVERGLNNLKLLNGTPIAFRCVPASSCTFAFTLGAAATAIARLCFCFVSIVGEDMTPIYYIVRSQEAMSCTDSGSLYVCCEVYTYGSVSQFFADLLQITAGAQLHTLKHRIHTLLSSLTGDTLSDAWAYSATRILSLLRERDAIEACGVRLCRVISNLQVVRHFSIMGKQSKKLDVFNSALQITGRQIVRDPTSSLSCAIHPRFAEVALSELIENPQKERDLLVANPSNPISQTRLTILVKNGFRKQHSEALHHTTQRYMRCQGFTIPLTTAQVQDPCTIFLPPYSESPLNLQNLNRTIETVVSCSPQNEIAARLHRSESELPGALLRYICEFGDNVHQPSTLTIPFVPFHAANALHAHAYFCQCLPTVLYAAEDITLLKSLANCAPTKKTIDEGPLYGSSGLHSTLCETLANLALQPTSKLHFLNLNINFPPYIDIPETWAKADLAVLQLPTKFAKFCENSGFTPQLLTYCIEAHSSNSKYKARKKSQVSGDEPESEIEKLIACETAERGIHHTESGAIALCGFEVTSAKLIGSAHIHCVIAFHSPPDVVINSAAVCAFLFGPTPFSKCIELELSHEATSKPGKNTRGKRIVWDAPNVITYLCKETRRILPLRASTAFGLGRYCGTHLYAFTLLGGPQHWGNLKSIVDRDSIGIAFTEISHSLNPLESLLPPLSLLPQGSSRKQENLRYMLHVSQQCLVSARDSDSSYISPSKMCARLMVSGDSSAAALSKANLDKIRNVCEEVANPTTKPSDCESSLIDSQTSFEEFCAALRWRYCIHGCYSLLPVGVQNLSLGELLSIPEDLRGQRQKIALSHREQRVAEAVLLTTLSQYATPPRRPKFKQLHIIAEPGSGKTTMASLITAAFGQRVFTVGLESNTKFTPSLFCNKGPHAIWLSDETTPITINSFQASVFNCITEGNFDTTCAVKHSKARRVVYKGFTILLSNFTTAELFQETKYASVRTREFEERFVSISLSKIGVPTPNFSCGNPLHFRRALEILSNSLNWDEWFAHMYARNYDSVFAMYNDALGE